MGVTNYSEIHAGNSKSVSARIQRSKERERKRKEGRWTKKLTNNHKKRHTKIHRENGARDMIKEQHNQEGETPAVISASVSWVMTADLTQLKPGPDKNQHDRRCCNLKSVGRVVPSSKEPTTCAAKTSAWLRPSNLPLSHYSLKCLVIMLACIFTAFVILLLVGLLFSQ